MVALMGMLIISPEADGVVRRVPLVVDINGEIFPSMSMEIIRTAAGDISYQIKTGAGGVEDLMTQIRQRINNIFFISI